MIMTELCFNIWYYLNKNQTIKAISARGYFLEGPDENKSAILAVLSKHEYKIVHTWPVPELLRRNYGEAFHYTLVHELGVEEVYKEIFSEIQKSLPKNIILPEDKLFYATPLYDFGKGFVPAVIGNGFIRER